MKMQKFNFVLIATVGIELARPLAEMGSDPGNFEHNSPIIPMVNFGHNSPRNPMGTK